MRLRIEVIGLDVIASDYDWSSAEIYLCFRNSRLIHDPRKNAKPI
jgi:hypothetical protein